MRARYCSSSWQKLRRCRNSTALQLSPSLIKASLQLAWCAPTPPLLLPAAVRHALLSCVLAAAPPPPQPERAFAIVRTTASAAGAETVSRYRTAAGSWGGAIKFLLMAQRADQAFELTCAHRQMAAFIGARARGGGSGGGGGGDAAAAPAVATWRRRWRRGGGGGTAAARRKSRRGRARARDYMLMHTLINYLMGETDDVFKDPNRIYRLYLALSNYQQAATGKTAIIFARSSSDLDPDQTVTKLSPTLTLTAHARTTEGPRHVWYTARRTPSSTKVRRLEDQRMRVPQALRHPFLLLHSYTLANLKRLARRGEHEGAARMLLRVARSASRFPAHTVAALTSQVPRVRERAAGAPAHCHTNCHTHAPPHTHTHSAAHCQAHCHTNYHAYAPPHTHTHSAAHCQAHCHTNYHAYAPPHTHTHSAAHCQAHCHTNCHANGHAHAPPHTHTHTHGVAHCKAHCHTNCHALTHTHIAAHSEADHGAHVKAYHCNADKHTNHCKAD
ncbi:hypothetical protein JKP88DRAFT_250490 [Tribonema minus]|uniref:Uncharacterized protein n=1 Tax=Tribonema minus TaxID=303371 RepID=A0A835YJF5_9STRA|nr:hypothetical protein JKP88DRAFT_250490 [Tribonema minus]